MPQGLFLGKYEKDAYIILRIPEEKSIGQTILLSILRAALEE
jgi:hypothetical protein